MSFHLIAHLFKGAVIKVIGVGGGGGRHQPND